MSHFFLYSGHWEKRQSAFSLRPKQRDAYANPSKNRENKASSLKILVESIETPGFDIACRPISVPVSRLYAPMRT
ncbi:hypothetical protein DXT91_24935 [Agrobacterium tumefaciens]|nr:hypothetical protein [Agrobacterium tumefaciens]